MDKIEMINTGCVPRTAIPRRTGSTGTVLKSENSRFITYFYILLHSGATRREDTDIVRVVIFFENIKTKKNNVKVCKKARILALLHTFTYFYMGCVVRLKVKVILSFPFPGVIDTFA
jgi:hypothetical protein